ncbi:MAG TPA: MDR family MFS transporter [Candidatus Saccharibacteria bacterium]|nr:MDR family MFS transporter [Candidatus Saccharibacteria bacterium]
MHHHLSLRSKVIIMASVMASMFLVALDQTIIATALGKIVEEFNAYDSLSWIVTAYLLTTTITVPIAGKLSDLFGRKLVLLAGVAIFGAGSLLSGMAGDVNQLVLWRAVQGIGGGIITANAFTIIGDLFAARERGRWQGMIGAVFGLSSVIGPLLGGWLTDGQAILGFTTDWRWTFLINVPVAIIAFLLIMTFCPPLKHDNKPKIDYFGAVFLTIALATLVLAVDNTETIFADVMDTFNLSLTGLRLIMGSIVALATAAFVWTESRVEEPIIPLRFFKNRTYSLVMIVATLFGAGFMGSILYLTQFNQQVFGAGPTESGLMLIPMVAGIMVSAIGSGQLISRTGKYKRFMEFGVVLATIMIALLTTLTPESPYWHEAIIMVALGFGLGLVMPIMNIAVQNEFEQRELGVATSSVQLFRTLGSTVGIAIFGAMLTAGLTANLKGIEDTAYIQALKQSPAASKIGDLSEPNTQLNLNMPDIKSEITKGFETSVANLPEPVKSEATVQFKENQSEYSDKIIHAFSKSLRSIFVTSASLMFIAAVVVFFIREKELKHAAAGATPGEM